MKLQNILFPNINICSEGAMYCSSVDDAYFDFPEKRLIFKRKGCVEFGGCFNLFSWGKWNNYTILNDLELVLEARGKFIISVLHEEVIYGEVIRKVLKKSTFDFGNGNTFTLEIEEITKRGHLFFSLEALEEGAEFFGGYFETKTEPLRKPMIALNICSFHKDEYVYRNINMISDFCNKNPDSPINRYFTTYIVDNGETIKKEKIKLENVVLIYQHDKGSTGGFTRGLIEIIKDNQTKTYTNVIMMDDDIRLDPHVLERTWAFISFLDDKYTDRIIGGQMMIEALPFIQHEAGGKLKESHRFFESCGNGLDLRDRRNLLINEFERNATLNAWWYCCYPMEYIRSDNLPYPMFFHMEDMDYGLRTKKPIITMDGIAVWHPDFVSKNASWSTYYNFRNRLILFNMHMEKPSTSIVLKSFIFDFVRTIMSYKYLECELLMRAVRDYLRGPKWMEMYDNEHYLEEILAHSYKSTDIEEAVDYNMYMYRLNMGERKLKKIIRLLTLNGLFLPANKNVTAPMTINSGKVTFRAKKVFNYDFVSQKGYVTEKSVAKSLKYYLVLIVYAVKILLRYRSARKRYIKNYSYNISLDFWNKKLEL